MLAVLKVAIILEHGQEAINARLICPNCPSVQGKKYLPEEIAYIIKGIDPSDTDAIRLAILNHHLERGFSLVAPSQLERDLEIEVREYYLGIPQVYKRL